MHQCYRCYGYLYQAKPSFIKKDDELLKTMKDFILNPRTDSNKIKELLLVAIRWSTEKILPYFLIHDKTIAREMMRVEGLRGHWLLYEINPREGVSFLSNLKASFLVLSWAIYVLNLNQNNLIL